MARRSQRTIIETEETPIDEAVRADQERIATDLASALESLGEFTDTGTNFKVYKVPRGQGKYEWCFDIQPPFNHTDLMEELRDKYGPGDYCIRVYVNGQAGCKAQRNFSIAGIRQMATAPKDDSIKEVLPLIIAQMNGSKSDMLNMMQMQQQQSQNMMQLIMTLQQQAQQQQTALITAMFANREKPGELIAAFAPLLAQKQGGFGEVVDAIKAVKEIAGGSGGGDDDSLLGLAKVVAPAIPDLAKSIASAIPRRPQHDEIRVVPQHVQPGNGAPQLEGPTQSRFPLLTAIREDVLFYFARGHDPEFAAEGIAEMLDKAGIKPETDLAPIVAAFLSSSNWIADLAAEGIDLTSNPEWAQRFLNSLIAIYNGEADDPERGGGSAPNVADHGDPGSAGVALDQGAEQGA